jgi:hypothetical protein
VYHKLLLQKLIKKLRKQMLKFKPMPKVKLLMLRLDLLTPYLMLKPI